MPSKITKRIKLDFKGAKGDLKSEMKDAAGESIVEDILDHLGASKSPVLSGKFKKKKKNGQDSHLFQDGDLWASISFEQYRDGVEVGIFDQDQIPKADNHNKNSAASKGTAVPAREFIPKKGQDFRDAIIKRAQAKINKIAKE